MTEPPDTVTAAAPATGTVDVTDTIETPPDDASGSQRLDRWAGAATIGAIGITAAIVWLEAETEPFHIDEYRQVGRYDLGVDQLIDASFAQEQPPLDVLVGSTFQRVLGVGDVLQRSHSMLAGILALAFFALLLWRYRVRLGVPVAVLIVGLNPAFASFTAYARPYALPLALMTAFLLATDVWLERASRVAALSLVAAALLLPTARVFEPPALLVLTGATLLIFSRRRADWGRRIWLPIGSILVALLAVEIPVYLRLESSLTAYQRGEAASIGEQFQRVVDDSLPRLAEVFVNEWFVLLLVAVAISLRPVRQRLYDMWWFWPLALTPLAFAVAFHIRTQPDQPFYERYGYFWLLPVGVVAAVVTEEVVARWPHRTSNGADRTLAVVVVVAAVAYGALVGRATVDDLSSTDRPDLRSLGEAVEAQLPVTTAVVFEPTGRELGSFELTSPPHARYTSPEREVYMAAVFAWWPQFASSVERYAIATNGPVVDIPGWTAVPASSTMTLYVTDGPNQGAIDLAEDLVRFGDAHDVAQGATLRLAGGVILVSEGDVEAGCDVLVRLIEDDPTSDSTARTALTRLGGEGLTDRCLSTD